MKNTNQGRKEGGSLLFAAKESYRTIRTNLMFSMAKKGCKTILFTSSIQGEGKTTTSSNVAFSIARSNKKVLLVDLDLRRPHIHRLVKLSNTPGITNILSGFNSLEETIHKDVFKGLDVICAGTLSPNPAEIIASEELAALLEQLKADYDFIILDTPPINVVSDALTVIPYVDGVVMVARPNYTARKELQNAIGKINMVGGKILGVVANGARSEKRFSDSRYGRYSRYATYGTYSTPVPSAQEQAASNRQEQEAESEETEEEAKEEE